MKTRGLTCGIGGLGIGLLIWMTVIIPPAFAADLTLNTWAGSPLSKRDRTGYIDRILIEAFNRIGLTVSLSKKPAERSLYNANKGVDDGDYIRVAGLEKIYPNLIRVPSKLFDMEFVAFAKNKTVKVDGWASLKPYHVGILRGWKILEMNVKEAKSRSELDSIESMFKMVDLGRLDIALYSRYLGRGVLENMGYSGIRDLNPPFAVEEMFLYLNNKHAKLVPELAKVLETMKHDGTIQGIFDQTLKQLD